MIGVKLAFAPGGLFINYTSGTKLRKSEKKLFFSFIKLTDYYQLYIHKFEKKRSILFFNKIFPLTSFQPAVCPQDSGLSQTGTETERKRAKNGEYKEYKERRME